MSKRQQVQVESRSQWRNWLEQNHQQTDSIWLVTFKKRCPDRYVAYNDVVEEALCFGWVDSLPRKLDENRTMLLLSPRKPGSNWSKLNKTRVQKMMDAGLMTDAGLEKINAAKRDGSWHVLDKVEALEIPTDLDKAFKNYKHAKDNFEGFPPSVRRGILEWIINAKKPATRAKRVAETARLAEQNLRANQWSKK